MAADFSAPSFSLGLDLDHEEEEEDEEILDLDNDLEEPQRPGLKRLRRGLPPPITSNLADDDDDIEDFSSQENVIRRDPDMSPSLQSHATCSSSKASLHYRGILSTQSTSKSKTTKTTPAYKNASVSANFEASSSKDSFPRLPISPLRKYKLESDPSFSLGLDLDFGEDQQLQQQQECPSFHSPLNQEEEDDIGLGKFLNHDNLQESQQRPVLKRLRRGLPPPIPSKLAEDMNVNLGAEINDLSSQEGQDHRHPDISPSVQSHATCSSSKVSLTYRGVLNRHSANKLKTPEITTAYNTSVGFEASSNKGQFPKLTVSPLRKIHILDSDSDEPSSSKGKINSTDIDPSDKKRKAAPFQSAMKNAEKTFQSNKHQAESFWKDFSPKEKSNLATPVLDEFCNEYFKSSKDQKVSHRKENAVSICSSRVFDPDDSVDDFEVLFQQKGSSSETDHNWDSSHPKPPAYQYFYHDDARVRTLVQERLPHFAPIGSGNHSGTQRFEGDDLDYIGQFCHGACPNQGRTTNKKSTERNSRVKQKRPNATNSKEAAENTGNWVNPRNSITMPKDAGRRRVSAADSQSGGRWFTGQDGRKVYVSKNGQELTGQFAYRQYRKESGSGFRSGKKKAATTSKKKKKS